MGKKRIATKEGGAAEGKSNSRTSSRAPKKKIVRAVLSIEATFNNTKANISDTEGNVLFWSSAGSLGFKGAKKGTPFAASKVGEVLGEKAKNLGIKEIEVIIKGVGSGREPVARAVMAFEIDVVSIKDRTPVPHNGPKAKKPRRV